MLARVDHGSVVDPTLLPWRVIATDKEHFSRWLGKSRTPCRASVLPLGQVVLPLRPRGARPVVPAASLVSMVISTSRWAALRGGQASTDKRLILRRAAELGGSTPGCLANAFSRGSRSRRALKSRMRLRLTAYTSGGAVDRGSEGSARCALHWRHPAIYQAIWTIQGFVGFAGFVGSRGDERQSARLEALPRDGHLSKKAAVLVVVGSAVAADFEDAKHQGDPWDPWDPGRFASAAATFAHRRRLVLQLPGPLPLGPPTSTRGRWLRQYHNDAAAFLSPVMPKVVENQTAGDDHDPPPCDFRHAVDVFSCETLHVQPESKNGACLDSRVLLLEVRRRRLVAHLAASSVLKTGPNLQQSVHPCSVVGKQLPAHKSLAFPCSQRRD
eukprot:scaffold636_cov252-Pinguiococcus_pyrenoidosus.AAC.7